MPKISAELGHQHNFVFKTITSATFWSSAGKRMSQNLLYSTWDSYLCLAVYLKLLMFIVIDTNRLSINYRHFYFN